MTKSCYFCDLQKQKNFKKIAENEDFFARYAVFLVSPGHVEIVLKPHIPSISGLTQKQAKSLFAILEKSREIVEQDFNPDGFNIGINDGEAAGQSVMHLHIHLMPRYFGDMENPRGGVRNIFPEKGDYTKDIRNDPKQSKYLSAETKYYNKLVRDKIPEICQSKGEKPIIHIASKDEFEQKLTEKLSEEVAEFAKSKDVEELADILEVVIALCKVKKIDFEKLDELRKQKAEKRGGFTKRIILDRVEK